MQVREHTRSEFKVRFQEFDQDVDNLLTVQGVIFEEIVVVEDYRVCRKPRFGSENVILTDLHIRRFKRSELGTMGRPTL